MAKAESGASNAAFAKDLMKVCEALEVRYGRRKPAPAADFIEALVYQVLELGVPEKAAREALKRLREEYVDWNDMRVATVREIQDVLGARYYRCREKSEDIKHLLADLYTAFRRMEINDLLNQDGIETLRALPETTNIRRDMVDRALLIALNVRVFPCDEDQFRLLKFLGGVPKPLAFDVGVKKVAEAIDAEQTLRLSRGLREHMHTINGADEDEPQPISFGWDQKDPLGMDRANKAKAKKPAESAAKKPAKKK